MNAKAFLSDEDPQISLIYNRKQQSKASVPEEERSPLSTVTLNPMDSRLWHIHSAGPQLLS